METTQALEKVLSFWKGENTEVSDQLNDNVVFDTPKSGRVEGKHKVTEALMEFKSNIANQTNGLEIWNILNDGSDFIAAEVYLNLIDKSYPTLPIAVAANVEKGKISGLRIYHSNWALLGKHELRKSLFPETQIANLPDYIAAYHQLLLDGDANKAVNLLRQDATLREPSGDLHGHGSKDTVKDFFTFAFNDGPVKVNFHTFAEKDGLCAAEYTCYYWGNQAIPPQAGMEFWELDKDKKIKAVRIYDDVHKPNS